MGVFTQLGLTIRQAEVFIAISKLGQANVKTIAKTAQTDRAEIYRTVPKLQKLGIVKKIITTPISFKAIPLAEALSILLEQSVQKHKEIRVKAEQFLRNFNGGKPNNEDFQYSLTSGPKAETREFTRNLRETQTSIDGVIEWRGILYGANLHFEDFEEALRRGVKIRRITYIPKGEKIPQAIKNLKRNGSLEIGTASAIPKAGIDILDKKSVHIITIPNSGIKEIEVLRSNNPAVVELAQDYFELKWQSAKKLVSTKT